MKKKKKMKANIRGNQGYEKTGEKGQGSEEEMARLKRVREASVREEGMLLMIKVPTIKT